ncbi:unnamed protein product [Adineta steineri]|uniref:G domain-containing protein n=1 Tax=Adineta steineri TaxID=433720 RepID=A0A814STC5_9BILA|nr:unnamed protein product [Adineta steineri]CAF1152586.1 unnamed protein product [Adineta steineri]CAF4021243.1 unnamed protein product [Adineta steineri]CAF4074667.1 unnamed protein product [Adineta steineri]
MCETLILWSLNCEAYSNLNNTEILFIVEPAPGAVPATTPATAPATALATARAAEYPAQIRGSSEEAQELRRELDKYRKRNEKLMVRFEELMETLKNKRIKNFEDLAARDQESKIALVTLAKEAEAAPLVGLNIGFFGLTSTGKSTMLNSMFGKKVAETGYGETTTKITKYAGNKFILWDVPGRNDEVSYFTLEYISFFKGLKHRLVLIQATVKDMSSMMKLLDEINLDYDIVVNKFDMVPTGEQETFKNKIKNEIKDIGLKGGRNVYFISAENIESFDWLTMINHLTT